MHACRRTHTAPAQPAGRHTWLQGQGAWAEHARSCAVRRAPAELQKGAHQNSGYLSLGAPLLDSWYALSHSSSLGSAGVGGGCHPFHVLNELCVWPSTHAVCKQLRRVSCLPEGGGGEGECGPLCRRVLCLQPLWTSAGVCACVRAQEGGPWVDSPRLDPPRTCHRRRKTPYRGRHSSLPFSLTMCALNSPPPRQRGQTCALRLYARRALALSAGQLLVCCAALPHMASGIQCI